MFELPHLHIHQIDRRGAAVHVVGVSRENLAQATFLDQGMGTIIPGSLPIPTAKLLSIVEAQPLTSRPINYIFHSAYCGSTLLARCLDATGAFLAYKEPLALTQHCLSGTETSAAPTLSRDLEWDRTLRLLVTAFSRTFHAEQVSVVKPMDWCNSSIGDLLRPDLTKGRVAGLYLYSDLESFVCAVLPWPKRRATVRDRLPWASAMMKDLGKLGTIDIHQLSDAESAAYLWLAQQYNFMAMTATNPPLLRSLDCEVFFERPIDTLRAVAAFFGKPLTEQQLTAVTSGGTLDTYSKGPPARGLRGWWAGATKVRSKGPRFSTEHRVTKIQLVAETYGAELASALAWVREAHRLDPLPENLPCPLEV